ncbi:hypothetical protein C8J56DRAFT_539752 [Mycena floridula]|nr:hypothetical protein C8J56DRAFT_539752 [Mycena floridula]
MTADFSAYPQSARINQLLAGNESPLDSEISACEELLAELPNLLSDIDTRIATARTLVEDLERAREDLIRRADNYRVITQIIRRIPSEVLAEIFFLAQAPVPNSSKTNRLATISSLDTRKAPWTISQVCRRWRSIALNFPSIWNRIVLVQRSKEKPLSSMLLGLQLHRCGTHPLSVVLATQCTEKRETFNSLIQFLLSSSSRWQSLRIHMPLSIIDWALGDLCLPSLSTLCITTDIQHPSASPFTNFLHAPNLRSVISFPSIISQFQLPWSQITHFAFPRFATNDLRFAPGDTNAVHVALLHRLTGLQHCELQCRSQADVTLRSSPARLPNLKALYLERHIESGGAGEILSNLTLPALETLKIVGKIKAEPLSLLLERSGASLLHLNLRSKTTLNRGCLNVIRVTRGLQTLSVDMPQLVPEDFLEKFLPSDSDAPVLLPLLHSLKVIIGTERKIPTEMIEKLKQVRPELEIEIQAEREPR